MTEKPAIGHLGVGAMESASVKLPSMTPAVVAPRDFDALYSQHFGFVWRNLRRLGVPDALAEDAAQDVFVVVHRRLRDLQQDASLKAWLFGIALRVASDYRRTRRRKPTVSYEMDTALSHAPGPSEQAENSEAVRVLQKFLATLDEDKRAVFVLAELEDMSAPEMSEALEVGVNTVYSRLRVARERFVKFLDQEQAAHG
jgi:RNA polymerase sigma-70 factor, ECF subfamily